MQLRNSFVLILSSCRAVCCFARANSSFSARKLVREPKLESSALDLSSLRADTRRLRLDSKHCNRSQAGGIFAGLVEPTTRKKTELNRYIFVCYLISLLLCKHDKKYAMHERVSMTHTVRSADDSRERFSTSRNIENDGRKSSLTISCGGDQLLCSFRQS